MLSKPQEQNSSSISEDVGPVMEATPDSSPRSAHQEPTSEVGSQTNLTEEQSSSDTSGHSDTSPDYHWLQPEEKSLRKVTISAFTETGQQESSVIVPLQRAYTGRKPVISSRLADTSCATLGVRGLLDQLNTTLGTSYIMDTPSLSSLLEGCITNHYDFGMAYGRLRQLWYINDWSNIRDRFHRWEEEDQEMRRKALVSNQIINPKLPPRRVWDLFSNRVVPWWCTGISCNEWYRSHQLWPISHAWMDEKDRVNVQTPINEYKWPVPIPKDTSLNLVRIEMLNLGAQYAWLDVLCLRQVGGPGEHMRKEEWKLDVPTIGTVYHLADVVIYMSGLGRPLSLKDGDLDSDRCWFRRAWTLQEVGEDRVIAGDTPDGPMHAECKDGKYETPPLTRFHEQLESMDHILYGAFAALEDMQNRVSTNPVDKVAGLAFCQLSKTIPAYYESESLEGAWTALMNSMDEWRRGLLFLYPEPGSAGRKWRPSWDQLMTKPLPAGGYLGIKVNRDEMDEDWCDAECIEKGFVRWLTAVEEGDRRGQLIVNDKGGTEHAFNITAAHEYPIPEDMYALICGVSPSQYWVVGRRLPEERFEKVSVFQMSLKELNRFRDLHITEECRNILV